MSQVFRRIDSYETAGWSGIEDAWLGPVPMPVWLCGSGPSLTPEVAAHVRRSGAPVMCVNFSGRGPDGTEPMLRPDFWTAFDPTARFHRSIFLSPRTAKFVPRNFHLDLVPGTNFKVCDCPNVHFFEREHRGYADFLAPCSPKILDCLDSLGQAIDILFRLGFRTIYTVGTEMRIRLSEAQQALAASVGVTVDPELGVLLPPTKAGGRENWSTRLLDVLAQGRNKPPSDAGPGQIRLGEDRTSVAAAFEALDREEQYAFSERKRFLSACTTDQHYFNVVQFLRLSRRCFVKHGVRLVDCSGGRLSEFFEAARVSDVADRILAMIGDPAEEATEGRYERRGADAEADRLPGRITMVDIPPHRWDRTSRLRAEGGGGCGCGKKKAARQAKPEAPQAAMPDEKQAEAEGAGRFAGVNREVVVDEVA